MKPEKTYMVEYWTKERYQRSEKELQDFLKHRREGEDTRDIKVYELTMNEINYEKTNS